VRAGVLNVDKAPGATSFSVVRDLRRLTGARRVGHAGTLDPLATGVLPILFESATRLSDHALKLPKTYLAEVHLGFRTITDDAEAEPEPVGDPGGLDAATVEAALAGFVGRILQAPPAYSAVKLDGERSYRRARRGEEVQPAPRPVEIYSARMAGFQPGAQAIVSVEVVCASGTYLRSLARDLGDRLGVGGYLGKLVRTAYGPMRIDSAVHVDSLAGPEDVEAKLLPPETLLPEMQAVRLTVEQEAHVRQGRSVRVVPEPGPGPLRAHDLDGRLVALGHTDPLRRTFVPDKVLN
jgi:tRNA pseudouridine55 synthase